MIEHLDGYFNDFGESVVFGTSTTTAIVDMPTIEMVDALAREVLLTVPEVDVSGVSAGSTVTVRAVAYKVRTVAPDGSGLVQIAVTKP